MIDEYQIIICGMVANIELTGYNYVSLAAIESWQKPDFVDKVLIVDGKSIDNTVSNINNIHSTKIEVITSIEWPITSWTWDIIQSIENSAISHVNSIKHKKKILMMVSSDTVFTDSSSEELENACKKLIEQKKFDYINHTFKKAITANFVSENYPILSSWYVCSIMKFQENIEWKEVSKGECDIVTNRPINGLNYDFKSVPICYDLFNFTSEQIRKKIERHVDFVNKQKPSVQEYIVNFWIKKLNNIGIKNFKYDEHPNESKKFIDKLSLENFGHSLFNNVHHIKTKY